MPEMKNIPYMTNGRLDIAEENMRKFKAEIVTLEFILKMKKPSVSYGIT